ncbi:MAG: hypothetical protein Q9213_001666 [Squamulea squamosa]
MDCLPPEIMVEICHNLYSQDAERFKRTIDLKSLRLCCRSFAGPAAQFLFNEVLLFMDFDSLRKLSAIAEHPVYRHKVECVQVFGSMISENLVSREEYEHDVRAISIQAPGGKCWGFDEEGKRSLSQQAVEEGYNNYTALLDEQMDAFRLARTQIPQAISQFKRLDTIMTSGFHSCLDANGIVQPQPRRANDIARILLMPLDGRLWTPKPYPPKDAELVCGAVAESQCSLKDLWLGAGLWPHSYKILEWTGPELDNLSKAFQSTQLFAIALGAAENWGPTLNVDELPGFGFLDRAPNLRSITIMSSVYCLDTACLLGSVYWPCLEELNLHGLSSSEHQLGSIFRSVQSTIKYMSLLVFVLTEGSWYNVFHDLKGCGLDSSSLDLCGLCCFDGQHVHGIDLSADPKAPHIALIKDFVCNGKEWSKDLPEFLTWEI